MSAKLVNHVNDTVRINGVSVQLTKFAIVLYCHIFYSIGIKLTNFIVQGLK